jgi:peptidoglycan/LPS O-acetylase OafA/YrhL
MTNHKTAHSAPAENRIVGIELLRFACAVAVLIFHYQHFAFVGLVERDFDHTSQPFYSLLRVFYEQGFYGVQVFWCISGFIFFWKYGRSIPQRRVGAYKFFVLRFSRLYPLHFVTLLFMAVMQVIYLARTGSYYVYPYNDAYHFVLQLFLASNWGLQLGDSFNGPIWSISVEVLAYTIFFVLLRYVSGSLLSLVLMVVASMAVQALKLSVSPLFTCLMFFYLGCLTAAAFLVCAQSPRERRLATLIALAALVALGVGGLFVTIKAKYFLAVAVPALIFLCVTHIPSTPTVTRVLVPAGNMTYSSYLLHVPLQIVTVLICTAAGLRLPIENPLFFLGYLVITLVLSKWSYSYLEVPAQDWLRNRYMRRTPEVAQSPT